MTERTCCIGAGVARRMHIAGSGKAVLVMRKSAWLMVAALGVGVGCGASASGEEDEAFDTLGRAEQAQRRQSPEEVQDECLAYLQGCLAEAATISSETLRRKYRQECFEKYRICLQIEMDVDEVEWEVDHEIDLGTNLSLGAGLELSRGP